MNLFPLLTSLIKFLLSSLAWLILKCLWIVVLSELISFYPVSPNLDFFLSFVFIIIIFMIIWVTKCRSTWCMKRKLHDVFVGICFIIFIFCWWTIATVSDSSEEFLAGNLNLFFETFFSSSIPNSQTSTQIFVLKTLIFSF